MLKNIDPLLRGELLKALDELGHGNEFVLVDRNFPAYSGGLPVIDLGEVTAARVAEAVFSVVPLDTFGDVPVARMAYDGEPETTNQAHDEVLRIANDSMGQAWNWKVIPRLDFYPMARKAALVIRCLEDAPYACFIFRKGIV